MRNEELENDLMGPEFLIKPKVSYHSTAAPNVLCTPEYTLRILPKPLATSAVADRCFVMV